MSIRHITCALSLVASIGAQAQVCSGGPGGGMDATGNQCNTPGAAGQQALEIPAFENANRKDALVAYESGHYARAAEFFRAAAEQGDVQSAETLSMMYRLGPRLYAGFPADPTQAGYWAAKATQARARVTLVKSP